MAINIINNFYMSSTGQIGMNIAGFASGMSSIPTKFTKLQSALETAVKQVLYDTVTRQDLIQRGLERVKHFTWKQSVQTHLAVYEGLAKY